ncbi:MAG: class IV adenylate cyclase [Deltaproteobacteria bacterium]|nr:class IV adenylate cyclase [Deltaproteobacteria bacterium]MBW2364526.1 class IV adenylate cyclase [Deltaproteobacteria bacterium]
MNNIEIEVKFYLDDIKPIQNYLVDLGAVHKGRFFESNIRFEDKNNKLLKSQSLLRLRKDAKTTLTYKSKPPFENNEFKIHQELEVEVNDFEKMNLILESLGFHQEQIYEKWRETFIIQKTIVCIDQMPFGDFLEIEGEMKDIKDLADTMALDWEKRILLNYIELFDIIKQNLNLSFNDITFNNFKDISVDVSKYQKLFEAGKSSTPPK